MITISRVGLALAAAMFFSAVTPMTASAAITPTQKKKLKKDEKALKALPEPSPVGKINGLLKKVSKINPSSANRYLKQALPKLSFADADAGTTKLLKTATTNVKKSKDLSTGKKKSIDKSLKKTANNFTPTPPPPVS